MKRFSNKTLAATLLSVAAYSISMSAMATNGILPLGNGMIAHGVGGAGIANASEAMSGVDNPALLADTGNQSSVGASLFNPNRSADVGTPAGYVESGAKLFLIPQGAWTTKIDEKVNFGVLFSVLGGMNTEYPQELFGQKTGMDLGGIILAPTISYKPNAKSAVGASLLIGYEMLETFGPGAGGLPDDRKDSAIGFGVKLGFVTEVSSSVNLGAMYQSEIRMDEMDKHCAFIFNPSNTSDCALNLPPQFGVGLKVKANEQVEFVGDILRVNWTDVAVFEEMFGWENQTIIKLGFEYKMNSSLALRAGFNHGESPIPDSAVQFNVLAPAVTEDHLTFGFTQSLGSNMDVSGYYAYVFENEQTQAGGPAPRVKMNQHALGVGFNWKL